MDTLIDIVDNNKQLIPASKTDIEQKVDQKFVNWFVNNFNNRFSAYDFERLLREFYPTFDSELKNK